jgi:radical SAM superfamily enzyme YgiQ (UPF0313 family)
MDQKLDVLFIHPVVRRKGQMMHVLMPVGLFSLASTLRTKGYKTTILHMGVEELLDPQFDLAEVFRRRSPDIVCIDLYWYVHTYEAMQIAKLAKDCCGSFTVLGGVTASFFDQDIVKEFPQIDAVIRGDGEAPLIQLVERFYGDKDYRQVPNLTYLHDGQVRSHELSYSNTSMEDTAPMDLAVLDHYETYLKINLWGKPNLPLYALFDPAIRSGIDLSVYRGCPFTCAYCGGGREAQEMLFGRKRFAFKEPQKVLEDCRRLKAFGVEELRVEYVPYVKADDYYMSWFKLLRDEGLTFSCRFSFWRPPSKEMIDDMRRTFEHITVIMSPDSGSEKIRKQFKKCYYTTEQCVDTLTYARSKQMDAQAYFMVGFPGETAEDFAMTVNMAKELRDKHLIDQATCFALNIEPASPLHLNPERFGIVLHRRTLQDFYEWGREVAFGERLRHYLGFQRTDLSEAEILSQAKQFNEELGKLQPHLT